MRLRIEFRMNEEKIMIEDRTVMLSFFKKALSEYEGGKYFESYYSPAAKKPFTFSMYYPSAVFTKEYIFVADKKFYITWSSDDLQAGIVFYNAFLTQKGHAFAMPEGNTMTLKRIVMERETLITDRCAIIRFMSPFCVRDHNRETNRDYYYSIAHPKFQEMAKQVVQYQVEGTSKESFLKDFQLTPVKAKKTVVRYHGIFIESSMGIFKMEGDPILLNYLYQSGIGSKRPSAFGCFQVLS